jgi:hypothetical protein
LIQFFQVVDEVVVVRLCVLITRLGRRVGQIARFQLLLVYEMKLGFLVHTNTYVLRRMTMQIVNDLKCDCDPKADRHYEQHANFVYEIGLFREEEI